MLRTTSYENIGTTVNTDKISEALERAHLNYLVEKKDIFTTVGNENIMLPKKATVDVTNNRALGIVSDSYEICNNEEAFDFVNYIDEDIKFIKAGETGTGLVYVIGELPEVDVLGDSFKPNVIFQNSHNGAYSLKTAIVPLRIICQNQFNMAFKEANNTITIKHTTSLKDKMAEAKLTMKDIATYIKCFKDKAEHYSTVNVSENEIKNILNDLFPIKDDASDLIKERMNNAKAAYLRAYNCEDNQNFRGTVWGLLNAVTDYSTHSAPIRNTSKSLESHFITTTIDPRHIAHFMQIVNSRVATAA